MAKRGRKRKTVTGYFRKVFTENPKWVHATTNEEVLARYRLDHKLAPDARVRDRIKANMANVKSILRAQSRAEGNAMPNAVPRGGQKLDGLEEMIDDCLTSARNIDREGLDHIIALLRRARNQVVWKLGETIRSPLFA